MVLVQREMNAVCFENQTNLSASVPLFPYVPIESDIILDSMRGFFSLFEINFSSFSDFSKCFLVFFSPLKHTLSLRHIKNNNRSMK